jgi:hypothetical protein
MFARPAPIETRPENPTRPTSLQTINAASVCTLYSENEKAALENEGRSIVSIKAWPDQGAGVTFKIRVL